MKFIVFRTSDHLSAVKPCSGAEFSKELTHKIQEYMRDEGELVYTLEINTLEDLIAFVKKHDKIVLHPDSEPMWQIDEILDIPVLEIYDYYRE